MPVITNIEDLRLLAEKRVPRMFYDYADSGSWTEGTYRANSEDFQKIKLRQRVAVNMENRSTATKMVGQEAKMPVCIAPVGLTGMQSADGEIKAAKAAEKFPTATIRRKSGWITAAIDPVKMLISGISMAPLEYTANCSGEHMDDTISLSS